MPEDQAETNTASTAKPKLEKVKLKKPHTHRRKQHQPGDTIDVTPAQKKRLQDREII